MRPLIVGSAALASILASTDASGQDPRRADTSASPIALPFSRTHNLRSKINGQDYTIMVAMPHGYSAAGRPSDRARLPVLYLLDGNISVPLAWSIARSLAADELIAHPILVGIGYPVGQLGFRRMEDYSPTRMRSVDSARSTPERPVRTGGAAIFLRVLREEIIPFVESIYPMSDRRALLGVSMSGLFATYAMIEEPSLFDAYAIGSPSLWWDDYWIWKHYQTRAAANRAAVQPVVIITVGQHEWQARRDAERLADALYRDGRGVPTRYRVTIGANHSTSWHDAADYALRALYARPIRCALTRAPGDSAYTGECSFGARSIARLTFRAPTAEEPFIWRGREPGDPPTGGRPFVLSTPSGDRSLRTVTQWYDVTAFEADSQSLMFSYVWRVVDPTAQDLQILERARAMLADSTRWNRADNNEDPRLVTCSATAARQSLFCALNAAGRAIDGEYYGGRPAVEAVRHAIATIAQSDYRHPLVEFNSDPATTFSDIDRVLARAIATIQARVDAAWRRRDVR